MPPNVGTTGTAGTLFVNLKKLKNLEIKTTPEVEKVFNNYPDNVRKRLVGLRELIVETAKELEEITILEETLKWGEPSYITKHRSTLRIDWKSKAPGQ